jgi:succinyl-CoA:acetate CoA-transferase
VTAPDDETQGIANHLIAFFEKEVAEGRLPKNLGPLQAGIGSIANAVLTGLKILTLKTSSCTQKYYKTVLLN